jgi:uncharacterized protein YraI
MTTTRSPHPALRRLGAAAVLALLSLLLWAAQAMTTQAADARWQARYWDNRELRGDPVLRREEDAINHDWGSGSPDPLLFPGGDNFSARWTRTVNFPAGTYRFTATTDDGMRVWVDDRQVINSWADSQVHTITGDIALTAGDHAIRVEYYEAGGQAVAKLNWAPIGGPVTQPPVPGNWRGEYFNGVTPGNNLLLVRDDPMINFNWGSGSPAPNVPVDRFSARWTRTADLAPGRYRFQAFFDDGVRVWVNGRLVIDEWHDARGKTYTADVDIAGGSTSLQVDYYENIGDARAQLTWSQIGGGGGTVQPPPATTVGNATVLVPRLNVRSGPGTRFERVATLTAGQTVPLVGYRDATGSWTMIRYNNANVWVSALPGYLQPTVAINTLPVWTESGSGSFPAGTPLATVGSRVAALNLRSGPDTTFPIITALRAGTVVALIGRTADNGWVQVRTADGTTGWLSAPFVIPTVPLSSVPITG